MNVDFERAQSIFLEAVEKTDTGERARFLDQVCGDDQDLRSHLERLIHSHNQSGSFLEQGAIFSPTVELSADEQRISEQPGERIGPYKLLQRIGEGGMGVVYMADQIEPVQRRVALKIIKPGMDTRSVIARFEAERQALAMMDHPGIAKVLDAGTTDTGRPYFVMELVKGIPVTNYCDQHQLTPRQRLELFVPICQAVQHAHQKGIIHRDIKPSNVLVARYDGDPVPKVIDFGVAKATGQRLTERTMFTEYGQIVGTIEYMSPEQAEFNQSDIDTRSDIYSLGVLLYELLVGEPPFDKQRLRTAAFDELLRIIREEEPPRPSTKISSSATLPSVAANRHVDPGKLSTLIRGELDWIVMKALEKDRSRRYETANGLAADIQRYLCDEPVVACPPAIGYRFRVFLRRNRVAVATASLIGAVLIMATVVSAWEAVRATRAETLAQDHLIKETRALQAETKARGAAEEATELASRQAELTRRQRDLTFENLYVAQIRLAHLAWKSGNLSRMRKTLNAFRPQPDLPDVRGWEWFYLQSLLANQTNVYEPQLGGINNVCWSRDGRLIAIGGRRGAQVYDPISKQVVRSLPGHTRAVWSPNGVRLATVTKDRGQNYVQVWNAESWQPIDKLVSGGPVVGVVWSPDSSNLAWTTGARFSFWREGQQEAEPIRRPAKEVFGIRTATWGSEGRLLLMAGAFPSLVCYWDTVDNELAHSFGSDARGVTHIALHPQGRRFATATIDGELDIRAAEDGKLVHRFRAHNGHISACDWSRDGKRIVSGGEDNLLRIFDVETGQHVNQFPGHAAMVRSVDWSPTQDLIVSGSADGTVRFWRPDENRDALLIAGVGAVAWSPDGRYVVSNDARRAWAATYSIFDSHTGETIRSLERPKSQSSISVFAWSPDGKMVGGASFDGTAYVWNAETGRIVHSLLRAHNSDEDADHRETRCINWAPDGRLFSTCGMDGLVKIWETSSGKLLHTFADHNEALGTVCWSPCGRWFASADWKRDIKIRRTDDWQVEWEIDQPPATIGGGAGGNATIAWSPNSNQLATVSGSGEIVIWKLLEGQKTRKLWSVEAHTSIIRCLAWSPYGNRIASGSEDRKVKIWDAKAGRELLSLDGHQRMVFSVVWSPDGLRLASTGDHSPFASKARIWDATAVYDNRMAAQTAPTLDQTQTNQTSLKQSSTAR